MFAWLLIAMTFIDADTQMLPDDLTFPLLWAGLLVNINGTFVPLQDAVIGAAAGYLALWAVYWASSWRQARKEWAMVTSSCWQCTFEKRHNRDCCLQVRVSRFVTSCLRFCNQLLALSCVR